MNVTPSTQKPVLGVSGHAGAGHVHSHSGFIQDDSAGFAAVSSLIGMAYPVDTIIQNVSIESDTVEVHTCGGGTGRATARRGFTPYESELVKRAIGLDGLYSQAAAFRSMGRIYGQGVMEVPVALQTAICLAVINTFSRRYPDDIITSGEGIKGNVGACMGAVIDVDGLCVAAMAVLNATEGGLGPVEDLEGNLNFLQKGQLMKKIGLDVVPTIVLETKAYIPSVSDTLDEDHFWIRYNREFDNPAVGKALITAAQNLGLPLLHSDTAYPRYSGEMLKTTNEFAVRIIEIAEKIKSARTASEKVSLVGELSLLVSQDAGGITYMTDRVHENFAGAGIIPGMTAVLSMTVSKKNIDRYKIPEFTANDNGHYLDIIVNALRILSEDLENAQSYLSRSRQNSIETEEIEQLILR
ncbi:MAG: hypothetical protein RQ739_08905 [Desulfotignum sp.]|nr:hypothetical protein [Desulfotignum sp.]